MSMDLVALFRVHKNVTHVDGLRQSLQDYKFINNAVGHLIARSPIRIHIGGNLNLFDDTILTTQLERAA